jgi:hypothetical protein
MTTKKIARIIKLTQPTIMFAISPLSKINATKAPMTIDKNPDIPASIHELITKTIAQRLCNPALAPLKFAPVNLALVKFAPRISASLKSAPERSFPLKD